MQFVALVHPVISVHIGILRDCYESFAMYCFGRYLIACLGMIILLLFLKLKLVQQIVTHQAFLVHCLIYVHGCSLYSFSFISVRAIKVPVLLSACIYNASQYDHYSSIFVVNLKQLTRGFGLIYFHVVN